MFEYNKKTNLLESTGQAYPLEDVREPNLYRDFFSYEDIPRVVFNRRLVPIFLIYFISFPVQTVLLE